MARSIVPAELKSLRAIVASEKEAYRRGELRKGLKLSLAFHEHTVIIDALADGNGARAAAAMTAHLEHLEGQLDLSDDAEAATDLVALFGVDEA